MTRIFEHEVDAWAGLYPGGPGGRRYAIFQRQAERRVQARLRLAVSLLEPRPGLTVLDIGCGPGALRGPVVERGGHWIGCDIALPMLIRGRATTRTDPTAGRWVCGDALSLPFPDQSVDAVACVGVLNFYPKRPAARVLSEAARVLRPDGHLIVTSLHLDVVTWLRSRLYGRLPLPLATPGPLYPFAPNGVRALLAGLPVECRRVVGVRKYGFLRHYSVFVCRRV